MQCAEEIKSKAKLCPFCRSKQPFKPKSRLLAQESRRKSSPEYQLVLVTGILTFGIGAVVFAWLFLHGSSPLR